MSKYEQFQHLFVADGDNHLFQSEACFDSVEDLTYRLIDYSDWYIDDVEYISLGQPILPVKPQQVMRVKRTGKNRDRIREVATWVNDSWSLGIRFRLRPHVTVSFQPREVMFVLPIMVSTQENETITLQTEAEGTLYTVDQFDSLVELTFDRIQKILDQGVQHLISRSHRPEELHDLGFVLDSEDLEELGLESHRKSVIAPAQPEQTSDRPAQPESAGESGAPTALAGSPAKTETDDELTTQAAAPTRSTSSTKKTGRSRKSR